MPIDWGFNFRASSGYVTDGTGESPVLSEAYTHTYGNGAVAGWTVGGSGNVDRNSGLDRRLAGINYGNGATHSVFRVDLPSAGSYTIHLAIGDPGGTTGTMTCLIVDNATPVISLTSVALAANVSIDATGTSYSYANWPASETGVTVSFASTILLLDLHEDSNAFHVLQHLRIVTAGGGGATNWGPWVAGTGLNWNRLVQDKCI